jgi:hypothetical protein
MTSAVRLPAEPEPAAEKLAGIRSWRAALVPACYLVAAVILTWRLWVHPATVAVAGNPHDTSQFAWFIRYSALAILHGRLPALVTTTMNAPQGISLMWNTTVLLPGVLLTPVTALAGPQVSLNLLVTIGFAGSATSLWYVLRRYGASMAAATVGGAVYGFSPALTHAAVGHFQLQFLVLPPLIIDACVRLCLREPRPLLIGAWLGLLVSAQVFIGEEVLAITVLAAAVLVTVLAVSRPRLAIRAAGSVAGGLAAAGVTALVLVGWALRAQLFGPLSQHGSAFKPDAYENDLLGFITPSSVQVLHTGASAAAAHQYPGGVAEYVAYLGVPLILALLIAMVVWWRHLGVRSCAVTLLVLAVLSLGAHPMIGGTVYNGVSLPWRVLDHLPLLGAALPDRLSLLADGAAAATLAFAIDLTRARLARTALGTRARTGLAAALVALAVLPLVPLPLEAETVSPLPPGWSATFGALRLPADATVLVVPVPTPVITNTLRWQADTGPRISLIGGYFEGPGPSGQVLMEGNGLPYLARYLDNLWTGTRPLYRPPAAQMKSVLSYWNLAAVVADLGTRPALQRYLVNLFGPPTVRFGSMAGWRLSHGWLHRWWVRYWRLRNSARHHHRHAVPLIPV